MTIIITYAMRNYQMTLYEGSLWKKIASFSIPLMFTNILQVLFNMSDVAVVGKFAGAIALGSVGSTSILVTLFTGMLIGFASGVNALSALYIGSASKKDLKETVHTSALLFYSFMVGLILGLLLYIFRYPFLSFFTNEPSVVSSGIYRLSVMAFSYCISAFMDCTIAASRGLGKTAVPTVIVILGSCVFRILWIYTVFACFHTIISLYALYAFSWTITAIAEIIYFIYLYKRLPVRS